MDGPGLEFSCSCALGWTSQYCDSEINECESSPCQNGGVCVDKIASYACACPMGFTGLNCEEEILKCENSPCKNNALCLMEEGIPVCYCVPDYHGERCELQYDECQLGPRCLNGGVCIDGVDSFTCSCPPSLTGILCECLLLADDEMDCNYTAPTRNPLEPPPSTPAHYPETTLYSTMPATMQFTTPDGEPVTTVRSRFSSTTFHGVDTRTFRSSTGGSEFHHSTISSAGHTHSYTDEGTVDGSEDGYTRFATRPTPGPRQTSAFGYTTYEPTKPVPTDAPDHITHFFTEFPRTTAAGTEEGQQADSSTTTFKVDTTTAFTTDVETENGGKTTPVTATELETTTPATVHQMTTHSASESSVTTEEQQIPTIPSTSPITSPSTLELPETQANECAAECKNGGTCSLSGGSAKVNTYYNYHLFLSIRYHLCVFCNQSRFTVRRRLS